MTNGEYPKSLHELESGFSTQEECLACLENLRWPNGVECLRCRGKKVWKTKRKLFHCAKCGFQFSVTSGTIFHGTRKPLQDWFQMIWNITEEIASGSWSSSALKRSLKLGCYETAWKWAHKIRFLMKTLNREPLSDQVELNCIRLRNSPAFMEFEAMGRMGGAEGSLFAIAAETKNGRFKLQEIPSVDSETLREFLIENINPKAMLRIHNTVHRDCGLSKIADPWKIETAYYLKSIDDVERFMQFCLGSVYRGAVKSSHLALYADHISIVMQHRSSRKPGELFYKILKEAVKQEPIKTDDLRESAKGILADEPKPEMDNSKPGLHQLSLKTLDEIYEIFTD
jgi:transposase-like protein